MSEYQFYEFRSIDRPLTTAEQQTIGQWSSRTYPTSTGATFTYSYGDFPQNPKQVVAKYFDAMFYIANWGSKQLILRFPKEVLDSEAIQPYCTVDEISLSEHGKYFVLEMAFPEEEGDGWIEGEGYLSSLIGLRQDILRGDYRSLYIAWLHACSCTREWDEFDITLPEPPLSQSLKKLTGALECWVELLDVDVDLLSVASKGPKGETKNASADMAKQIAALPDDEKNEFLHQMLREEPLLSVKLHKRLQALSPQPAAPTNAPRRTIGAIFQQADQLTQRHKEAERQKREKKKLQKFVAIEADEAALWQKVSQHISEKKPQAYDAAIAILKDLLALAKHRGTQPEYEQRVEDILQEYARLSSLKTKIERANLLRDSV